MGNFRKTWLSSAIVSLLLVGCGGEGDTTDESAQDKSPLVVNSTFAATYHQTIAKAQPQSFSINYVASAQQKNQNQSKSYDGKLEVTNILNKEKQVFDWPITQKVDSEGNVETISHRALTLKPGSYDFVLLLTSKDATQSQYVAQALGEEVVDGESPEIDFVLLPNLGDTISDFEQVQHVSTLKFSWPAKDLAALSQPQFGLSINDGEEKVYSINKETGIAELVMNVEPGEYQLAMHLYDGDMMVGKNEEEDTSVNFVEGEDASMDVIPLQADMNITLDPLKGEGAFTFIIPEEVINEVGSAQELALIVRLGGDNVPVQEKVLSVQDVNGIYKASDLFKTGGQENLTVYLAFHKMSEASDQFNDTPFANCNTTINPEQNQALGCKLELKRESIITGRVLGTLMLNVLDKDQQPALGVKVYVNDKLIGLTGGEYNTGSIKAHLVSGEHEVKAQTGQYSASENIEMQPLDVVNKVLHLERSSNIGNGNFIAQPKVQLTNDSVGEGVLTDIDGDGDLDYVVPKTEKKEMIAALNDGKGNFKVAADTIAIKYLSEKVVAADIDGDGDNDLLVLAPYKSGNANQFFYNDGAGHFTAGQEIAVEKDDGAYSPTLAQFADLDNDGDLDLVVKLNRSATTVFMNDGKGNYSALPYEIDTSTDRLFVISDINGDKYPDIVTSNVWLNDHNGGFSKHDGISVGANIKYFISDDFNSDGTQDLFAWSATSYYKDDTLLLNDGFGKFTKSSQNFIGSNAKSAVVADFNSDGSADLIMTAAFPTGDNSTESKTHLYANTGQGEFETPIEIDGLYSDNLLAADIDGDGDIDIINQGWDGIQVYLNQPAQ